MNTAAWISIEDAFPPLGQPVLVSGVSSDPAHAGAVQITARLVESWERSETDGMPVCVWADEDEMDELAFDPSHWQPIQAQALA
ncbi:DUF551 domain-containing protein [Roseateles chitinivorans]|uniref:DUF551 domain-containing protein n=1 Tax=Roseateles chitinivorans TaxID=2917965 RepID=UPI003D66B67E